ETGQGISEHGTTGDQWSHMQIEREHGKHAEEEERILVQCTNPRLYCTDKGRRDGVQNSGIHGCFTSAAFSAMTTPEYSCASVSQPLAVQHRIARRKRERSMACAVESSHGAHAVTRSRDGVIWGNLP